MRNAVPALSFSLAFRRRNLPWRQKFKSGSRLDGEMSEGGDRQARDGLAGRLASKGGMAVTDRYNTTPIKLPTPSIRKQWHLMVKTRSSLRQTH